MSKPITSASAPAVRSTSTPRTDVPSADAPGPAQVTTPVSEPMEFSTAFAPGPSVTDSKQELAPAVLPSAQPGALWSTAGGDTGAIDWKRLTRELGHKSLYAAAFLPFGTPDDDRPIFKPGGRAGMIELFNFLKEVGVDPIAFVSEAIVDEEHLNFEWTSATETAEVARQLGYAARDDQRTEAAQAVLARLIERMMQSAPRAAGRLQEYFNLAREGVDDSPVLR